MDLSHAELRLRDSGKYSAAGSQGKMFMQLLIFSMLKKWAHQELSKISKVTAKTSK